MEDLRGEQGVWRFDGETVEIRYQTKGWFRDPLLKRIGQLVLPVAAIAEVTFQPGAGRRRGWVLHLRLRERMDPYAAVGAMLRERSQPFRLTGPASVELVAEYLADQIRFAAGGHREPPAPEAVTRLVPRLPFHIQTSEGTATVDDAGVRLVWSGGEARGRKRRVQRREFTLDAIAGVEWTPSDGWEWGYLRLVPAKGGGGGSGKPAHDLNVLRADEGSEGYDALLMAATVTAHLWARDRAPRSGSPLGEGRQAVGPGPGAERGGGAHAGEPGEGPENADTEWIFRQIGRLGELHARGLLTDEEFSAKKTELLDRI